MLKSNHKNSSQKCCNNCEHSYYVYGCEIACEYEDKCGTPIEAIASVSFESALKLANEWLDEEIVDIHEVGTTFYFDEEYGPQIIES